MKAVSLFAGIAVLGNIGWAQTALTGGIQGTVQDATGAAVVVAQMELSSASLSMKIKTATDASGAYRFVRLTPAGDYQLTVGAPNLEAQTRKGIEVSSGDVTALDITLVPAAQRQQIDIAESVSALATETMEISGTVATRQLNTLPSNGRNLNRFALLDAKVRNPSALGGDGFSSTRLSINGATFRDTQYRLDGNTNYDTLFNNSPLQRLSISSVQEYRVLTNQFNAEHGSTSTGLVITTTKSGTDQFHGEGFFYARPSGIQSRPPLANLRIPNELMQGGGAIGGPILKSRTYFFANYERINQNRGSFINPAINPAINSPAPSFFVGNFRDNLALAKFDHRFTDRHWISARVNGHRDTNNNPNDRVGGLIQPSAANVSVGQAVAGQVTDTMTWGSVVNELRAGYTNAVPSLSVPLNPQLVVNRPGYSTEGSAGFSTVRNEVYQLADQVAWQRGSHTLKFGGDFIRRKVRELAFDAFGTYTFPGGAPIPGQVPTLYTQRFGVSTLSYGQTQWAGFIQDTWRIHPRLTLNLGLRYDYQSLLDDYNGPRAGFAWDIGGDGSTIFRGGFGMYYDQPFFHGLTQRFLLNGLTVPFATFSFTPATPGFPQFPFSYAPTAPPSGPSLAPRNVVLRSDNLLGPYTTQFTLGIQRRLPGQWVLSVDGIRSLAVKQFLQYDRNASSPFPRAAPGQTRTAAQADRTRPFFDPARGVSIFQGVAIRELRETTNGNTANYHALDVKLSRRFMSRYSVGISYVWSSALNSITDDHLGANPQEWSDVQRGERALSDFAQRHRFVANASAILPWKIQASMIATLASGLPVNAITGVDNNGDGLVVDRPAGFGRNAFRGTEHRNFDFSFSRPIAVREKVVVELRADMFNLFNNQNYYRFNNVYGNGESPVATFLRPIGGVANVDPARQFTFGLKVQF